MTEDPRQAVRQFYDHVGWQKTEDLDYQNAQYEDLRPVSQAYIHRCHMRVKKHLAQSGKFLLDAGSGPVQYPEYLTYSEDYSARVCADLSIVALKEARKRLAERGRYVVMDVANPPFMDAAFDGVVSLHTIHHLPLEEKISAYEGLYRVLMPGKSMVIVDGWTISSLMARLEPVMRLSNRFHHWWQRTIKKQVVEQQKPEKAALEEPQGFTAPAGTYIQKLDANWLKQALKGRMTFKIRVWRSLSVRFLRSMIYPGWGGRVWLWLVYLLEELFPQFLGEKGQYPLVVVEK